MGIRGQEEQEKRATTSLLAVMRAVPEFGQALLGPLGAPKGRISTYAEVQLKDSAAFGRGATTADAIAYGARMLRRFPVDWDAAGFGEDDLHGLAEIILRLLTSLLEHPSEPPPEEARLRAFLTRWLAPALRRPASLLDHS